MIPAEVSLANRAAQASDVAINPLVLGALTPAIVALDAEYFWRALAAQRRRGCRVRAALNALVPALAVPPPLAPPGSLTGCAGVGGSRRAETTGQAAAGEAMKESGQAAKFASDSSVGPTEGISQAAQAVSTLVQPLQSAMQPLTGMFQPHAGSVKPGQPAAVPWPVRRFATGRAMPPSRRPCSRASVGPGAAEAVGAGAQRGPAGLASGELAARAAGSVAVPVRP